MDRFVDRGIPFGGLFYGAGTGLERGQIDPLPFLARIGTKW